METRDGFKNGFSAVNEVRDLPAGDEESVSGLVEQIVYKNNDTGYTVCRIDDDEGRPVTATGILPYLAEGDRIRASGKWVTHKKYGKQFEISIYDRELPEETCDILRYLSSGAIKGIGPKTAAKIVSKFGSDTFEVIECHPEWLDDIPGITRAKALEISKRFKEQAGSRDFMMFCRDFFSPNQAMKIYKAWGSGAVERIRSDPYCLISEFNGIGFKRADSVAAAIGLKPDCPERLRAGVRYILSSEASKSGHTCLPLEDLLRCAADLLFEGKGDPDGKILAAVREMVSVSRLIARRSGNREYYYLPAVFAAESGTARKLVALYRACPVFGDADVPSLISSAEVAAGITYAREQREALALALKSGVMILTGGPGTGKTTIIKGLLHIFSSLDMDVCLAAPTGRAAKRMSEATACEAKTIHRLLEMEFSETDTAKFMRNETDPLDEKVIIIDEASMIDVLLMNALVRAIRLGARLILIGDADQIPSVGCGNVLVDIISSNVFPVVELTEIFRQAERSLITTNAHRINSGEMPDLSSVGTDFFFLRRERDDEIAACVKDLMTTRLPRTYGEGIIEKIQVITPSRKGDAGTEALNESLRAALNPPSKDKKEFSSHGTVFREGDKIMQTRNDYTVEWSDPFDNTGYGVFNGDVGTVASVNQSDDTVTVIFDERTCRYDTSSFDEIEHAYAITVHKSQGSEYPVVIIPLYNCPPILKSRNLLYTAITRASKMVILVGRRDILAEMVSNDRRRVRCTMLKNMLTEEAGRHE